MHNEFADKHVVVTGGLGALGEAVVAALLDRGATCHLPRASARSAAPAWSAPDRVAIADGVDLASEAAVRSYYDSLPPLAASVHLVGGFAMAPIADATAADLEAMFRLNVLTCFLCCREAVRAFRRGGQGGRIVNVAARPAVDPAPGLIAYAAAKAGVAALTRSLAAEVRDERILVNAILPSLFDTPGNRAAMPDADFTRWPKPSELAETIAFLASDRNRLTSGALVPAYGLM